MTTADHRDDARTKSKADGTYAQLKQWYVLHTFLVCNSSLHRAHHFLVCYAHQQNKSMKYTPNKV